MNRNQTAQSSLLTLQRTTQKNRCPSNCVHITLIHFNDVYEIIPVSGGLLGGLARVAALRKQLAASNPNTFLFFGGDLYNPSALGLAWVDGEPLAGQQSVAVMNHLGIDAMTFGDHELNTVNQQQFCNRLAATRFKMISSNLFDPTGQPFASGQTVVQKNHTFVVTSAQGETVRLGLFGLTKPIRLAQVEHSHIDWREAAAAQVAELRPHVDILVALTHQSLADDQALTQQFPQIDLVLGGDEHHQIKNQVAEKLAPIYKADSNTRSVYVIDLFYNTTTRQLHIEDRLQPITNALPDDEETLDEINLWVKRGFDAFRAQGWEPTEALAQAPFALDGFESRIRCQRTPFTDLITQGMMRSAAQADLAILCSWALRLDDCLPAGGTITRYDLMRTFPLGDSPIYTVEVPGSFLAEILSFGWARAGSGSFLLTTPNVKPCFTDSQTRTEQPVAWQINNQPLDDHQSYQVAMSDDLRNDYLFYINAERAQTVKTRQITGTLYQSLVEQLQKG